jgi:hypothetical protein
MDATCFVVDVPRGMCYVGLPMWAKPFASPRMTAADLIASLSFEQEP